MQNAKILWIVALVCLLVGANLLLTYFNQPQPQGEPWQVTQVLGGDRVKIQQNNTSQTLKLIGVNAPTQDQVPFGPQARARLEQLIGKQTVLVEADLETKDRADNLLGYVWKDRQLINQQLIAEGYALADVAPPNVKYKNLLENAQSRARLLEFGIWDPANPLRQSPATARQRRTQ
jgi:micrococcal nuclease